jgi:hypothetical protein
MGGVGQRWRGLSAYRHHHWNWPKNWSSYAHLRQACALVSQKLQPHRAALTQRKICKPSGNGWRRCQRADAITKTANTITRKNHRLTLRFFIRITSSN